MERTTSAASIGTIGRQIQNSKKGEEGEKPVASSTVVETQDQFPILRVPSEVLLLIFVELKRISADEKEKREFRDFIEWTVVTHVCHTWREIALGAPFLWSYIRITSSNPSELRCAAEMLHRSRNETLLSVRLDFDFSSVTSLALPPTLPVSLSAVIQELPRIRELDLRYFEPHQLQEFFNGRNVPQLQTLRFDRVYGPLFNLQEPLLEAPSLRRLSLDYCQVDLNTVILRQLTHLALARLQSVYDLLELLPSTPHLEFLDIKEFVNFFPHEVPDRPKVHLPFLKTARINASITDVASILSNIVSSPALRLRISTFWLKTNYSPELIYDLLTAVSSQYSQPTRSSTSPPSTANNESVSIKSLRVFRVGRATYVFQAFREIFTQEEMFGRHMDPVVDLRLNWHTLRKSAYGQLMEDLFSYLPLTNLVTLQVFSCGTIASSTWRDTLGSLPHIQSILVSKDFQPFTTSLVPTQPQQDNVGTYSLPFPSLSSVIFHDIFSSAKPEELVSKFINPAMAALYFRNSINAAPNIQHFILLNCPVLSDRLKAAVFMPVKHLQYWHRPGFNDSDPLCTVVDHIDDSLDRDSLLDLP